MKTTSSLLFFVLLLSGTLSFGQVADTLTIKTNWLTGLTQTTAPRSFAHNLPPVYSPALTTTLAYLKVHEVKVYAMADFLIYNGPNATPLWQVERHPAPYYLRQQKLLVIKQKKERPRPE